MTRMPSRSRPIQLAALLIEMDLLRCKCSARGDNHFAIPPAEVRALDGAVVLVWNPHVGPVDVSGLDIHCDTVRPMAISRDDLFVRTIRIQREHAAPAQIQKKEPASGGFAAGSALLRGRFNFRHKLYIRWFMRGQVPRPSSRVCLFLERCRSPVRRRFGLRRSRAR